MARKSRNALSASGRLPWATSTSPTRSYDTDRSRCHPAFPGSALASRESGNGEEVAEGFERLGQIALGHQHVADPIVI